VRRLGLACLAVSTALLLAGCGGTTAYSLAKTKTCLTERGVNIGGKLDFVASTATGGAFAANLGDNSTKLVFGQTVSDAEQIEDAYHRVAFKNVQSGLPDVLRRYNNAVTLWAHHPSDSDLALIVGCLR
jgi:hypothetical protein